MRQRLKRAGTDLSPESALADLRHIQRHTVSIDNGAPSRASRPSINTRPMSWLPLSIKKPTYDAQMTLLCSGNLRLPLQANQRLVAVGRPNSGVHGPDRYSRTAHRPGGVARGRGSACQTQPGRARTPAPKPQRQSGHSARRKSGFSDQIRTDWWHATPALPPDDACDKAAPAPQRDKPAR